MNSGSEYTDTIKMELMPMKYNVRVSMEIHIDAETPEQAENKVIDLFDLFDLFDWCLCPAPLNTVVEAVEIGESETHGEIEL